MINLAFTLQIDHITQSSLQYFSFIFYFFLQYFFFLKILIHAFWFWLLWVFVAACLHSLGAVSGGYSLVAVCRLLTAVASLVAEHRL